MKLFIYNISYRGNRNNQICNRGFTIAENESEALIKIIREYGPLTSHYISEVNVVELPD